MLWRVEPLLRLALHFLAGFFIFRANALTDSGVPVLRDNALQRHLAGVAKSGFAVSCSMCSFRRKPSAALARTEASVALRTFSGSRRSRRD
jgi:hypothetical protein